MSIAMRYARDEHDAADILSYAFVRVFKYIAQFDSSRGSMHAWVKTIVINEALDHVKKRDRFSNLELEEAEEHSISNSVIEDIDAGALFALIRTLPSSTQTVFTLYVVDGYNHREIATLLSISEGTSKWHLSQARKLLQEKITDYKKP